MRIAITADPEIPVPPKHYGGIERIIDLLVCGLVEKGHEVTLFGNGQSTAPCKVIAYADKHRINGWDLASNIFRTAAQVLHRQFDLIHSFGRLGYLAAVLPARIPKIMSYQRHITRRSLIWGKRLSFGSLHFTACGRQMTDRVRDICPLHVIYNSVSPTLYEFQSAVDTDAPLVFLGRVEHVKGAHIAVEVARRTGRKLIIAGNVPGGEAHREYFDAQILPHVDGDRIQYVGPVADPEKNRLLGRAAALLMPILWDEPFGIVMAEAMACGTPVIGLNRGALPEVVEEGRNGFVCNSLNELVAATMRTGEIRRSECRRTMEERFSAPVMVDRYLQLYSAVLNT
jgi:glycosyltransferase involved in cell wall biosynthesis